MHMTRWRQARGHFEVRFWFCQFKRRNLNRSTVAETSRKRLPSPENATYHRGNYFAKQSELSADEKNAFYGITLKAY